MFLAVDELMANPKSNIWKSIIINRQFLLGTTTDLFKMIPSRQFDKESRLKLIDFLIHKKILVKGDWFCDFKGKPIIGYMKGSPADPDVSLSLAYFGLDIEEYKTSLNLSNQNKRLINGKTISQSCLFTGQLQERIQNDDWYESNITVDERLIFVKDNLLQTTSSSRTY